MKLWKLLIIMINIIGWMIILNQVISNYNAELGYYNWIYEISVDFFESWFGGAFILWASSTVCFYASDMYDEVLDLIKRILNYEV